jgi:peptidoglycan/LPS O-acetylase OafA/YrhL
MLIPGRAKALPVLFLTGRFAAWRGPGEAFGIAFAHTCRMDESINSGWKSLARGTVLAAVVTSVLLVSNAPLQRGALSISDFGMALFAFYFALPAVALIGLPLFLILRALGWVRWWSTALAGALGGALVTIVLQLPDTPNLRHFPWMCGVGAAAALAFWWGATRRPKRNSGIAEEAE